MKLPWPVPPRDPSEKWMTYRQTEDYTDAQLNCRDREWQTTMGWWLFIAIVGALLVGMAVGYWIRGPHS